MPSFETLDPFRPGASAIIHGALLSLILFYMTVFAIPYSWNYDSNVRIPGSAGDPPQPLRRDSTKASERLQIDVIPTESADPQSKTVASSSLRAPAAPVRTRGVRILLDPYVGKYISNYPAATISIQIEGDPLRGSHLSLSLAAAGHPGLALSPVSRTEVRYRRNQR